MTSSVKIWVKNKKFCKKGLKFRVKFHLFSTVKEPGKAAWEPFGASYRRFRVTDDKDGPSTLDKDLECLI